MKGIYKKALKRKEARELFQPLERKKMQLLYFGDFHERQKAPASRIDDWSTSIANKVEEIKALAQAHNVTALIQPGDFLDSPKISDEFLYEVLSRWSNLDLNHLVLQVMSGELKPEELYQEIKKNKPMIGIVGNHELFGHSTKAFNKTTLSLLNQIGFMNLVTKDNPIYLKSEDGLTVAITGSNYHADIDRDPTHSDYIVERKLGDFHIHLVHGYGTVHDFGNLMPHTRIQDLGATQADLTIIGHDHIGFDPIEINGKWFVNPGAPVRLSNDEKEMNREVKVMLINIEKDKHTLTMIPLQSARPSQEVLDRSRIEAKHEQQEKLDGIKETIKNANVAKGDNIVEIVEHIAENKNISQELKTDVRELISKKAEVLTVNKKTPQAYYIQKLVLENFQSHAYSEFEFSAGLNVFTGESRSGKTSLIRALGWIYEDYGGASRRFIKTGAKSASATIYLSNGFIIARLVEAKAGGFNGYKVFDPSKNEWEVMNTKAIEIIQDILGYNRLQIDKTDTGKVDTIPLNFLRQGNSWFFIGDDTSGSQRAKILGTICGTNIADAAIREVEAKNKELTLLLRNSEKEILNLDIEAGCMTHVEQMERDIEVMEKLIEELSELEKRKELLELNKEAIEGIMTQATNLKAIETDLKDVKSAQVILHDLLAFGQQKVSIHEAKEKITNYQVSQRSLERIGTELSSIKDAQIALHSLKELHEQRFAVTKFKQDLISVTSAGKHLKEFSRRIPNTEDAHSLVTALRELGADKKTIHSFHKDLRQSEQQMAHLNGMVNDLSPISSAKTIIKDLSEMIEQKKSLNEAIKVMENVHKDIQNEENKITESTKEIKAVKLEYMDVFSHVTQCPLCLHEITRNDAISIAKNKFNQGN